MGYATASYGGTPCFGLVTSFQMVLHPTAQQLDDFFGLTGRLALFGGGRGRVFLIVGVWEEFDIPTLNADEQGLLSFADGIARTLTDTRGRSWSNVIFAGNFTPDSAGPRPTAGGWALGYRCEFLGLT